MDIGQEYLVPVGHRPRASSAAAAAAAVQSIVNPPHNFLKKAIVWISNFMKRRLILGVFIIFLVFVFINSLIMFYTPWFNNHHSGTWHAITDAIYFTSTTMSTVGYGDMTPQVQGAKLWTVFIQMTSLFLGMRLFENAATLKVY